MEIVEGIPVILDPAGVSERLRFKPGRSGFVTLEELLDRARLLIRLRAVYEIAYTGARAEDSVEVAGVVFCSRILRRNLDRARKVFPFIMTAGPELEAAAGSSGDLVEQYYLEETANIALGEGVSWLAKRLGVQWGLQDLSCMDPGSLEDWPITEQPKLFSIFGDTEKLIGVRLTESLLMIPRKSVSGILFPSEGSFSSCKLCDRVACPSRKAPFDAGVIKTGPGSAKRQE